MGLYTHILCKIFIISAIIIRIIIYFKIVFVVYTVCFVLHFSLNRYNAYLVRIKLFFNLKFCAISP